MAPLEDCEAITGLFGICSTLIVVLTSFLFYLRVRAVYMKSRPISALFGFLWLIVTALNILSSQKLHLGQFIILDLALTRLNSVVSSVYLPPGYCVPEDVPRIYYTLPCLSAFIYDTLVFLAISYRLAADAGGDLERSWRSRCRSIANGKGLHRLSRSLMQSGQKYYL